MAITLTDRYQILANTFRFMEEAHSGSNRLRTNGNGTARSYDHHPMEVALIFAEMEIFMRQPSAQTLNPDAVADKIVDTVSAASKMSHKELKNRIFAICKRLTLEQLTTVVGLLCHDTIEFAYSRHKLRDEKIAMAERWRKKIRGICTGAELVAVRLTDTNERRTKEEKRAHQMKLARDKNYMNYKKYDLLANMFDEALIPDDKRTPEKKRIALDHMHAMMNEAYCFGAIPLAYKIASDRIYNSSLLQLQIA